FFRLARIAKHSRQVTFSGSAVVSTISLTRGSPRQALPIRLHGVSMAPRRSRPAPLSFRKCLAASFFFASSFLIAFAITPPPHRVLPCRLSGSDNCQPAQRANNQRRVCPDGPRKAPDVRSEAGWSRTTDTFSRHPPKQAFIRIPYWRVAPFGGRVPWTEEGSGWYPSKCLSCCLMVRSR